MEATSTDRRQFSRWLLDRPVKICLAKGGHYLPGKTRDVSAGGALLELDYPTLLPLGRTVKIAVAWEKEALVTSSAMIEATVVRNLGHGGRQVIALQFDEPIEVSGTDAAAFEQFRAA